MKLKKCRKIKDNDNRRVVVKREESLDIRPAIPIIKPASVHNKSNQENERETNIVNVHERKRARFKTWYGNSDNKKKHNERVKEYSKKPRVSLFWQVFTATGAAIGVVPAAYYFFTLEERIYRTR